MRETSSLSRSTSSSPWVRCGFKMPCASVQSATTPSNASSRRLAAAQRMNAQLKESNAALARTLNAALIDNRRLTEELSETRMELADRRQNR